MNKEMKIPFTKIRIRVGICDGGSTCNGNGYKTRTLSLTVITTVGNGDDGSRCCTVEPKNFGKSN